ncbi:hypothetical protein PAXINDRAFT_15642 [Paxillus involutus ATCC 200175]|uniref:Uncharacterized protein n=1 Tax=Paxillus involutus ATCC 200175 TaxID=664439 RepID=A0A0C9TLA0_PAXIN|nr:hypothetical protein PAXINDRAFT_15642 [Paxillus involutus ATCC 200175]
MSAGNQTHLAQIPYTTSSRNGNLPQPQLSQMPGTDLFMQLGSTGRSNPYYRYWQQPQDPGASRMSHLQNERARLAATYTNLPHHPDTESGRQAYNKQVSDWLAQHGTSATPDSTKPFPLKPGTAPLASRECFGCGTNIYPNHRSNQCPSLNLPIQEKQWREAVSSAVGRALRTAIQAPGTLVQYVAPMQHQTYHHFPDNEHYHYEDFDIPPDNSFLGNGNGLHDIQPTEEDRVSIQPIDIQPADESEVVVSLPTSPTSTSPPALMDNLVTPSMISPLYTLSDFLSEISSLPTSAPSSTFISTSTTPFSNIHELPTLSSSELILPEPDSNFPTNGLSPPNSMDIGTSIVVTLEDTNPMLSPLPFSQYESVIDLYSLDGARQINSGEAKPFTTQVTLFGPEECLTELLDYSMYCKNSRELGLLHQSSKQLRMADGHVEHSKGVWEGQIKWGHSTTSTHFEVFPSGRNWTTLLGKPLLEQLRAVHNYSSDEISFPHASPPFTLTN